MQICFGPVCVPVTAILPLIIGFAHKYGYLKWVNPNWFSYRWLKYKYKQWCALAREREDIVCHAARRPAAGSAKGTHAAVAFAP